MPATTPTASAMTSCSSAASSGASRRCSPGGCQPAPVPVKTKPAPHAERLRGTAAKTPPKRKAPARRPEGDAGRRRRRRHGDGAAPVGPGCSVLRSPQSRCRPNAPRAPAEPGRPNDRQTHPYAAATCPRHRRRGSRQPPESPGSPHSSIDGTIVARFHGHGMATKGQRSGVAATASGRSAGPLHGTQPKIGTVEASRRFAEGPA